MDDDLPEFAVTDKVAGWLEMQAAGNDSKTGGMKYKIPGTEYKYKCGPGFEFYPSRTNPIKYIRCQGNRKMETSEITEDCVRKCQYPVLETVSVHYSSPQPSNVTPTLRTPGMRPVWTVTPGTMRSFSPAGSSTLVPLVWPSRVTTPRTSTTPAICTTRAVSSRGGSTTLKLKIVSRPAYVSISLLDRRNQGIYALKFNFN